MENKIDPIPILIYTFCTLYILYMISSTLHSHSHLQGTTTQSPALFKQRVALPTAMELNIADLTEARREEEDIPLFWHVAKSGGSTIKDMYAICSRLVIASDVGIRDGHDQDETIAIVEIGDGSRYVNVDTIQPSGILRAQRLGLTQSNLADIIIAPRIHEISEIFTPQNKGLMFALFRHPVERIVSLFYYLQHATWEPTYNPSFATMTLEEFSDSNLVESNIMVRLLSQNDVGKITQNDIAVAKEILRRKCLIGLMDQMEESIKRFDTFFNLKAKSKEDYAHVSQCEQNFGRGGSNRNSHPKIEHSGETYDRLQMKNWADMILYDYVQQLFVEQEALVYSTENYNHPSNYFTEAMKKNVADLVGEDSRRVDYDTPLFWLTTQVGGLIVKDVYGKCLGLIMAGAMGVQDGHDQDETLGIVDMNDGTRYVNVDTIHPDGILRAQNLGLAQSKVADIIIASRIHEISKLFTPQHRGLMFAFFQNPVDRVVALFYYLQEATWVPTYDPIYATMTIDDYADSELVESNIMVRMLSQNLENKITQTDVEVSKELIRQKCLIGLVDQMEESIRRFDLFFGFSSNSNNDEVNNVEVGECRRRAFSDKVSNEEKYPMLEHSGDTWEKLKKKNWADIILYEYVEQLFLEQGELVRIVEQ